MDGLPLISCEPVMESAKEKTWWQSKSNIIELPSIACDLLYLWECLAICQHILDDQIFQNIFANELLKQQVCSFDLLERHLITNLVLLEVEVFTNSVSKSDLQLGLDEKSDLEGFIRCWSWNGHNFFIQSTN